MLVDWNDTAHDYDHRRVHEQIAEQVARTPDAIAVVDGHRAAHLRRARDAAPTSSPTSWSSRRRAGEPRRHLHGPLRRR